MMRQIASFHLGDTLLGMDILLVKEINRQITISPVPGGPAHLLGLMNLRGRVVTVIDLNVCLGRAPARDVTASRLLILKTQEEIKGFVAAGQLPDIVVGEDIVGFVIDRMADVVAVEADDILPPPPHLVDIEKDLVQGVIERKNRLITLLDVPAVLEGVTMAATDVSNCGESA
jgi:purine-binding chemotaxis protein CheW